MSARRRRGRPPGEIRRALLRAVEVLVASGQPVTWRSLAKVAQVGWEAARRTVDHMVRDGVLVRIGSVRTSPRGRPMTRLLPAWMARLQPLAGAALAEVLGTWSTRPIASAV